MGYADRTVGVDFQFHRGPVRPLATEVVDFFAGDIAPSDHKLVVTTYAFDVDAAARAMWYQLPKNIWDSATNDREVMCVQTRSCLAWRRPPLQWRCKAQLGLSRTRTRTRPSRGSVPPPVVLSTPAARALARRGRTRPRPQGPTAKTSVRVHRPRSVRTSTRPSAQRSRRRDQSPPAPAAAPWLPAAPPGSCLLGRTTG